MKKFLIIILVILFIIISFSYGLLVGLYKIIPYDALNYAKKIILSENDVQSSKELQQYEQNIENIIHIHTSKDILDKRKSMIEFIWKGKGFPYLKMPDEIQTNIIDPKFSDLRNVERIDQITVNMEYGVNSISYLFSAKNSNNILVIYHEGHDGDFIKGKTTIQFFLEKGYSVLAFSMPLKGMNSQPVIESNDFGKILLSSHNFFVFLESFDFTPIKYFVEPIAVSLNYIDEKYDYDSYYMVGISGGGWTTILYPAIDERISKSYSIAGSYPIYLRSITKDSGDYEQLLPQLYHIADYLDLYIMTAYGDNRKLVQIFNKYDPCCFAGDAYESYYDTIKKKITELKKGTFEVYLDDTHREHKISEHALNIIANSMSQ